VSVIGVFV